MSIASRIARLCGWSPIGKLIRVDVDTCSSPSLVGSILSARIAKLSNDGNAVISLVEPVELGAQRRQEIWAQTRHRGYDFYHLWFGGVAVYLSETELIQEPTNQDSRFATALIRCWK